MRRVTRDAVTQALPIPPVYDLCLSFIGAFLGILWVAGCAHALDDRLNERLLVASLGATAVLLYGVSESKLSQPRAVIGTLPTTASRQQRAEHGRILMRSVCNLLSLRPCANVHILAAIANSEHASRPFSVPMLLIM